MKSRWFVLFVSSLVFVTANSRAILGDDSPGPKPPEGFVAIFNGKDLTGWEGSPKYWKVEDGCLTGTADGTLRYNRFITWRGGTVKNFELRVQVKVSPTGNSGLQYRGTDALIWASRSSPAISAMWCPPVPTTTACSTRSEAAASSPTPASG